MGPKVFRAWSRRSRLLAVALAVSVGAAIVGSALAVQYYSQLREVSPCYGGLGDSSCPSQIGMTFVQFGDGGFVRGAYLYSFLVTPTPPPAAKADSITLRAYNASSNLTLTLLNVTLSAPNGTLVATYNDVAGSWITSSPADI